MRQLTVHINQQVVGTLSETESLWRFTYDERWVAAAEGFDLSPALPRTKREHIDGGTNRPVQWYFDNLLPEQSLRTAVAKDARVDEADAFALLQYLGAESAGSLTLLPPETSLTNEVGLAPLTDAELAGRIRAVPKVTLGKGAPKRMSLAGAQHKLLVVYRPEPDTLFEPVGATPSTHILKPNHPDANSYASSVINEFFTMRLANEVGLMVPAVYRRYTPLPIYIIERFDRVIAPGDSPAQRRHIIDACQLLNRSFLFKTEGNLDVLNEAVARCRQKLVTRQRLFRWLVFNLLVGNDDNHLKNLSFTVDAGGIDLAPHYDLLATGVYHTPAFAGEHSNWPYPPLAIKLHDANSFHTVTRESVVATGRRLGLSQSQVERELKYLTKAVPQAAQSLIGRIETENEALRATPEVRVHLGGEMRLLRAIHKIIIPDMVARVAE